MRYYRDPNTAEIVAFDLAQNAWFDMRCDVSTLYTVRLVPTKMTTAQALALQSISEAEYLDERDAIRKANAAARGELFIHTAFGPRNPNPF